MNKIYVIAGNEYEAKKWIGKDMKERASKGETTLSLSEYVFIYRAEQLRGIRNPRGVFYGTWRDRPDVKEIFEALMTATTDLDKNSFFADMYFNWNSKNVQGSKPAPVTTQSIKEDALDANLEQVIKEELNNQLAGGYERGWDTSVKTMIDALLDLQEEQYETKGRHSWKSY